MNGDITIKEEDLRAVLDYFDEGIEMTYDELGHIYNEAGVYFADLDVDRYEIRTARMIVNKAGAGNSTFRVTLPTTWIRQMGLSEDVRNLKLTFDGEKIIIE